MVTTLVQKSNEIEILLKRSKILEKESRCDPWLIKILIIELLWGKGVLPGQSKPENAVRGYEQIFKAHLTDKPTKNKHEGNYFFFSDIIMADTTTPPTEIVDENAPLLPEQTKRTMKVLGILLIFSFLMFTLPFGAFFGTKYLLKYYFLVEGFDNTVWSVISSVITVNLIIVVYSYIAFHEPDYDKEGNIVKEKMK